MPLNERTNSESKECLEVTLQELTQTVKKEAMCMCGPDAVEAAVEKARAAGASEDQIREAAK